MAECTSHRRRGGVGGLDWIGGVDLGWHIVTGLLRHRKLVLPRRDAPPQRDRGPDPPWRHRRLASLLRRKPICASRTWSTTRRDATRRDAPRRDATRRDVTRRWIMRRRRRRTAWRNTTRHAKPVWRHPRVTSHHALLRRAARGLVVMERRRRTAPLPFRSSDDTVFRWRRMPGAARDGTASSHRAPSLPFF